jgi:hypothetical protein
MINFAIVCLITALIIRDRSINELFKIVIQKDESSIVIPGYQVACQETYPLRCEISIDNLPLVIAQAKGTVDWSCQATYGKQILACKRIRASAVDTVTIRGLHLSREQQKRIKEQIRIRSIASLRFIDDGIANGLLLQFLLGILSILSGIQMSEFFYFYFGLIYPHQNNLLKSLIALMGGFGVFLFLSIYFLLLLLFFGYAG